MAYSSRPILPYNAHRQTTAQKKKKKTHTDRRTLLVPDLGRPLGSRSRRLPRRQPPLPDPLGRRWAPPRPPGAPANRRLPPSPLPADSGILPATLPGVQPLARFEDSRWTTLF
ncbi:hypothetical protein ZWY2020_013145 [Hordeum vulgare]|nr:hypothetical protein ZWY2020_013145 [Hordeum vulgare]